jgi:Protein of unknown function (DUF5672)
MNKENEIKSVAVVIPIYKNTLTKGEEISLLQCLKILKKHPIILLKPQSLNVEDLVLKYPKLVVREANDAYFKTVEAYNRLMMSVDFFSIFTEYRHVLVYQLDAYVFRDDLEDWCAKNYDYVGAPWPSKYNEGDLIFQFKKKAALLLKLKHPNGIAYKDVVRANTVGNGGLSLRNVQKAIEVIGKFQKEISYYINNEDYRLNEDVFWSVEVNRYQKHLAIPDFKTALGFAFDMDPKKCFELAENKLPFGCHAWERYDLEFWSQFIKYE